MSQSLLSESKNWEPITLKDVFGEPDYNLITTEREIRYYNPETCQFLDDVVKIGEGSYAKVYLGKSGSEKVAIKNFKNKHHSNFEDFTDIDISTRILHPFLNRVYTVITSNECSINKKDIVTMMDFFSEGTLENVIKKNIKVDFDHVRNCCLQGLEFLHHCQVLHLDIKPENILYNEPTPDHPRGRAVIADFGLGTYVTLDNTIFQGSAGAPGTLVYISPDSLERPYYFSEESDVWAMGLTLASLRLYEDLGSNISEKVKSHDRNKMVPMFKKASRNYALEILPRLPSMFKYMIGERILPVREIMRRYNIERLDGTALVEDNRDLDQEYENDYYECLNYLIQKDVDHDLYFATIHLIYISFKAGIPAKNRERVYFCLYMMGKCLNYDEEKPGSKNYVEFRNVLMKYTGGCLRTFNPGDYIRTKLDYKTIGRYPSKPMTYFSNLAKLTFRLPPRGKLEFKNYRTKDFVY